MSSYAARRRRYGIGENLARTSNSSALSRVKPRNVSPVSSYYKPLLRTFTKRDDLQKINKVSLFSKEKKEKQFFCFVYFVFFFLNFI